MVMVTVLLGVGGGCELALLVVPPPPQATSTISSRSRSASVSVTAVRRRLRPAVQTRPKGASVANQKANSGGARRGEPGPETPATLAGALMVRVAVAPAEPGMIVAGENEQVTPDGRFGQESPTASP